MDREFCDPAELHRVGIHVHVPLLQQLCEHQRTMCKRQFFLFTMWVLGIKLMSSSLTTNIITHRAILILTKS